MLQVEDCASKRRLALGIDQAGSPALPPPGLHDVTEGGLNRLFVDPSFPQDRRRYLVDRLRPLVSRLQGLGPPCELWIHKAPVERDVVLFSRMGRKARAYAGGELTQYRSPSAPRCLDLRTRARLRGVMHDESLG